MSAKDSMNAEASQEKKQLIVQIDWVRPTKICAIFDLFLGIICYLISLLSGSWVIERYQFEDEEHDQDIKRYWIGLWEQCYRVTRAQCGKNVQKKRRISFLFSKKT